MDKCAYMIGVSFQQDGCFSTIEVSCTAVRDFTDFCFHSYFSYMDELSEKMPADEMPVDIKYYCHLYTVIHRFPFFFMSKSRAHGYFQYK